MEFDENSKNCHLSQEGSEQEFVTILLPIGEEIWRYSENSDGWSDPDYRYTPDRSNFSKNFFGFMYYLYDLNKGLYYVVKSQNTRPEI